jgi:hypothetical protein
MWGTLVFRMSIRRTHRIDPITINGIRVVQVIIDPHYEIKHSDHIDDALILRLVQKLNGEIAKSCGFEKGSIAA